MNIRRAILNAFLAASLSVGFAVAQDAPPPPDSQYPASTDVNASGTPQYQKGSDPQYATQDSLTMQQDQGGYPQTASAPPPPQGELQSAPAPAAPDQQMVSDDDSHDPSSRVARMQFMDGQVSIQPGGVNDWVAGTLNRPMTTGDNVWTDKDSKAELNVGTGVFRLGAETSLTLANVADKTTQIQLHQGTLNLRVRHLYDGEVYEIDTPNMAFTVQKPGDYRFDTDPNADTSHVTVWKGEGNATGDGPAVEVRQGEKARFSNGTSMAYQIDKAPGYDQFDQWAMARDQRDDNSQSAKYVSPDVIGSSDLDNYGTWKQNSDYGNVWVPNDQNQDWQPYSDGNWMYQQPYGWTWVGYEPWGFAPYHYGRWVRGGWGWGWAPGPYAYWGSPYYAPALVGWYGGGGFGFGVGFGGGFGWCPLGFGEPFYPWYRGGRNYFRNVNIRNTHITNITNITNNYYNNKGTKGGYAGSHLVNFKNGLVAAHGSTITKGLPVRSNRIALNSTQKNALAQHPAMGHNLGNQLRPTAQSRIGAQATNRRAVAPPARVTSRPTVSHLAPAARGRGGDAIGTNNRGSAGVNRTPSPVAHNIPRPPSAGVTNSHGATPMNRPSNPGNNATNGHYVPRPPSSGGNAIGNRGASGVPSPSSRSNNVPRNNGSSYSRPGQSYAAPHNVPRPSGPGSQPSRSYASPSRGYSVTPSYGSRSYNAPNYGARNYGGPSYSGGGREYSAPSAPHYSAPSAPHYSAPSGGGGGHYSAPSSHGGGGYSGGGHASSGGGGHASSGGGGHHR